MIDDFAPHCLRAPAELWLSESRKQVVAREDELIRSIEKRRPRANDDAADEVYQSGASRVD